MSTFLIVAITFVLVAGVAWFVDRSIPITTSTKSLADTKNPFDRATKSLAETSNPAATANRPKEVKSISVQQEDDNSFEAYMREMAKPIDPKIQALIDKHAATLARKWDQLVYYDDYDEPQFDQWDGEETRFISSVLRYDLPPDFDLNSSQRRHIAHKIHDAIQAWKKQQRESDVEDIDLDDVDDPIEYENAIAYVLTELGWNARTTQGSGDQGVDVIASKDGTRLVIQCKLYSQPVGNKAVQEVFAAKKHEKADIAAVVTNSTFTKSARQLAATTGVLLLHHSELVDIDQLAA